MKRHDSMRGYFAHALYEQMQKNKDIFLLVGDLGFGVFDEHFKAFPDRCINVGAAEQSLLMAAVGLALERKIPFVYSITPFLIYRSFETIRTYIDHENLNVNLIGSGRDKDYKHDGFSHDASDVEFFLNQFPNLSQYYPDSKEEIPKIVSAMIEIEQPMFLSLRR